MKRFFLFLTTGLFLATASVKAQTNPDEIIKFETEVHDFGKIKQNVPVNYRFAFKNISKAPLTIETATASCGCTTPVWPPAPVLPGKSDVITAGFNAQNPGRFEKTITIKMQGIDAVKVIKIMGEVVAGEPSNDLQPEMVKAAPVVPTPAVAPAQPVKKTPAVAKTKRTPRKPARK
jgi:hypothetical protein